MIRGIDFAIIGIPIAYIGSSLLKLIILAIYKNVKEKIIQLLMIMPIIGTANLILYSLINFIINPSILSAQHILIIGTIYQYGGYYSIYLLGNIVFCYIIYKINKANNTEEFTIPVF